jgi:hypothetical protein
MSTLKGEERLEHACFHSWHVYSRFIMHCDEWCHIFGPSASDVFSDGILRDGD